MSIKQAIQSELRDALEHAGFNVWTTADESLFHGELFEDYTDSYGKPLTAYAGVVDYTILTRPSSRACMILSSMHHDARVELSGTMAAQAENIKEAVKELYAQDFATETGEE